MDVLLALARFSSPPRIYHCALEPFTRRASDYLSFNHLKLPSSWVSPGWRNTTQPSPGPIIQWSESCHQCCLDLTLHKEKEKRGTSPCLQTSSRIPRFNWGLQQDQSPTTTSSFFKRLCHRSATRFTSTQGPNFLSITTWVWSHEILHRGGVS